MENKIVSLPDALSSELFVNSAFPLSFILGITEDGKCVVANLEKLPHLVIAGASGTGKSTLVHSIILSMAKKANPKEVQFLLCDTKGLEFSCYSKLPHLIIPPISDFSKIRASLSWIETESKRRIRLFQESGCRSIGDYNDSAWEAYKDGLPFIVIVIDDAAVAAQDNNSLTTIQNIAQSGRTIGIHLILITQSPSAKSISSIIRDYIPARAVFNVILPSDERLLLGKPLDSVSDGIGKMVFYNALTRKRKNVQCYNVSDYTINNILEPIIEDMLPATRVNLYEDSESEEELFFAAVDVVLESGQASVSMIQRRLKLGYARAARLIDRMEEQGIVGPFQGSKPRPILITYKQWQKMNEVDVLSLDSTITKPEPNPVSYSPPMEDDLIINNTNQPKSKHHKENRGLLRWLNELVK